MMYLQTFFRLLARPMLLSLLFLIFWAVIGPSLIIGQELGDQVIGAFRRGGESEALLHYALILGILLPAAFGLVAASVSLELQFTRMSWTLPGLSRRLTAGIVLLASLVAVPGAWLTTRASDPVTGVAAFAIGTFWFVSMLHLIDAAEARISRLLLAGAGLACLLRPDAYVALVTGQPVLLGAGALVASAFLIRRHTDADLRRRRMDVASSFHAGSLRSQLHWSRAGDTGYTWTQPMAGASPAAWTRAAAYEMLGMVRRGTRGLLLSNAMIGAIAYIVSPGMLLVLCFTLAFSGIQLRAGVLYPLSRAQRANVQFFGNFLDVTLLASIAGATAAALAAIDVPRTARAASGPSFELAMVVGLLFALAPIAQWARVRGPLPLDAMSRIGRHIVFPIAAWAAAVLAMSLLLDASTALAPMTPFLIIAAAGVAAQVLHFVGLRRYYATRDLA